MLDDRRDGLDGQRVGGSARIGDLLLVGDGEIALSGRHQCDARTFRGLEDVGFQALLRKVAQLLGREQAGVVGIRRPVQKDRDFFQLLVSALRRRLRTAGEQRRHQKDGERQTDQFFHRKLLHIILIFPCGSASAKAWRHSPPPIKARTAACSAPRLPQWRRTFCPARRTCAPAS